MQVTTKKSHSTLRRSKKSSRTRKLHIMLLNNFEYSMRKCQLATFKWPTNRDYSRKTLTNDIALAVLKEPLSTSQATPICLGGAEENSVDVVGAGWGMKNCDEVSHETLRAAEVKFPWDACNSIIFWRLRGQLLLTSAGQFDQPGGVQEKVAQLEGCERLCPV